MPAMTDLIYRWRIVWSGFNGGPGLSTFYTSQDSAVVANANGYFRTFFESFKTQIPNTVTITYPSAVDSVDPVTGFIGVPIGVTAPAVTTCTGTNDYPAPAGAQVRWHTDATTAAIKPPHGRRLVVGSTFIVPIQAGTFDHNGTILDSVVTGWITAANAMRVSFAENLRIWSRPVVNTSGTVLRAGFNAPVVAVSVKDRVAILKSRRA